MSVETESAAVCTEVFRLLKEAREKRGLSKYAIAMKSGLSQQAIGYVERGEIAPSLHTLLRIAKAMEVDFAEILREAERAVAEGKSGSSQ